jgi:hypothetical protein
LVAGVNQHFRIKLADVTASSTTSIRWHWVDALAGALAFKISGSIMARE